MSIGTTSGEFGTPSSSGSGGGGGGAVDSVSALDTSVDVSPTTGNVTVSRGALTGDVTSTAGTTATTLVATANVISIIKAQSAVTSVFTRTGAVTATSGDYTVGQVTGAAPLASPALTGTPTAPTATPLTNNTQLATTAYADAAVAVAKAASFGALKLTAVKTANYNAVASDMVACDVSAGAFTVTLPTAPADQTVIGVMVVKQATSPGAVAATTILTVAAGGSDVFDIAGGSQTAAMPLNNMQSTFIYNASQAIWTNGLGRIARASLAPTKTVAPTTTYTALAGDIVLATAGAGGFVVTLPAVTKNSQVIVKKVDSGAGNITVTPASGLIDGAATRVLVVQYDQVWLVADGTNWQIADAVVGNASLEAIVRANTLTQLQPPTAAILQTPQIFTASGTWTPGTAGAAIFMATLVGGGGGGGTASTTNGGGGGGGGEVLDQWYLGNVTGAQTITIGAGGATGAHDGNPTSIGALVTAAGGKQGSIGALTGPGGSGGDQAALVNSSATAGPGQAGNAGGWGAVTSGSGQSGGPGILRLGGGGAGGGGPTSAAGGHGGASTGGTGGTGAALGGGGGGAGGGGNGHNGASGVGGAGGDGTANLGGGGGGGGAGTTPGAGGAGGSGYVIITQIA